MGKIGRGERIRTSGPLVPNQMRYQAAPLPDRVQAPVTRHTCGLRSRTSWREVQMP
jgi:hypothetical protein